MAFSRETANQYLDEVRILIFTHFDNMQSLLTKTDKISDIYTLFPDMKKGASSTDFFSELMKYADDFSGYTRDGGYIPIPFLRTASPLPSIERLNNDIARSILQFIVDHGNAHPEISAIVAKCRSRLAALPLEAKVQVPALPFTFDSRRGEIIYNPSDSKLLGGSFAYSETVGARCPDRFVKSTAPVFLIDFDEFLSKFPISPLIDKLMMAASEQGGVTPQMFQQWLAVAKGVLPYRKYILLTAFIQKNNEVFSAILNRKNREMGVLQKSTEFNDYSVMIVEPMQRCSYNLMRLLSLVLFEATGSPEQWVDHFKNHRCVITTAGQPGIKLGIYSTLRGMGVPEDAIDRTLMAPGIYVMPPISGQSQILRRSTKIDMYDWALIATGASIGIAGDDKTYNLSYESKGDGGESRLIRFPDEGYKQMLDGREVRLYGVWGDPAKFNGLRMFQAKIHQLGIDSLSSAVSLGSSSASFSSASALSPSEELSGLDKQSLARETTDPGSYFSATLLSSDSVPGPSVQQFGASPLDSPISFLAPAAPDSSLGDPLLPPLDSKQQKLKQELTQELRSCEESSSPPPPRMPGVAIPAQPSSSSQPAYYATRFMHEVIGKLELITFGHTTIFLDKIQSSVVGAPKAEDLVFKLNPDLLKQLQGSGESVLIGWARNHLYSGFGFLSYLDKLLKFEVYGEAQEHGQPIHLERSVYNAYIKQRLSVPVDYKTPFSLFQADAPSRESALSDKDLNELQELLTTAAPKEYVGEKSEIIKSEAEKDSTPSNEMITIGRLKENNDGVGRCLVKLGLFVTEADSNGMEYVSKIQVRKDDLRKLRTFLPGPS